MSLKPLLIGLALAGAAGAARAGESACWLEGGVLVVPAQVAGVTGDFILDTGQAQTVLAGTQAEAAGYEDKALTGEVALSGERVTGVAVVVQDIDVRTGLFPTPIAGVIGQDVLKGFVLDLTSTPCRIRLSAPGEAPAFGRGTTLPLHMIGPLPAVAAQVSDGETALTGDFVISTGADAPIRLSDAIAAVPGAPKPKELYPDGVARARLARLTLAGRRYDDLLAGLVTPADPQIAGLLGGALFTDARLRLDLPGGKLTIAPNERGPGSSRGPRKSKARARR